VISAVHRCRRFIQPRARFGELADKRRRHSEALQRPGGARG